MTSAKIFGSLELFRISSNRNLEVIINHLKQLFATVSVVVALTIGGGLPAGAVSDPVQPTEVAAVNTSEEALPWPADAGGWKFWSPNTCVQAGTNTAGYPIGSQAQQWNIKTGSPLALDFSYDCAGDGYTPSRSMTIGVYSAPSSPYCMQFLNTATAPAGGANRWTSQPVALINYGKVECVGNSARRYHYTAMAIGALLGLRTVDWPNSLNRVMNTQQWSIDNVLYPTATEGQTVWSIYTGAYCYGPC